MRATVLSLLLSSIPLLAQERLFQPADRAGREAAATELKALVAENPDLAVTVALAAFAGRTLPVGSAARTQLDLALRKANSTADGDRARKALRMELADLTETLAFTPRREAEVPAGFPDFGCVDEIELRHYPRYRMAQTTMQGGSNSAFWPLFQHIESNGIAMTAPVQMDWQQPEGQERQRPVRMAFLYGDPATTPKKTADNIEVVEVAAMTALSIGQIGDDRRERVEQLQTRLHAFLAAHPEWEVAGPLRTMGYNSPMVSRDRRYFEVQLPVRPAAAPGAVVR